MAFHSLRNHNQILLFLLGFILITILLTAIINFNATNLQTHASGAVAAPSAPPGVFRLTTVPGSSDPNQDEWSMFRGQLNHTGAAHTPPISHTGPFWNYTTGGAVRSSPAVAGGHVYVGSNDKVYCLDATAGTSLWSYTTGGQGDSSPAVTSGRVYVGSNDNRVYCLNATTGEGLWSYTTGGAVISSPAVAGGRVFVGSYDAKVYCLPLILQSANPEQQIPGFTMPFIIVGAVITVGFLISKRRMKF
jgi:outer membrane protein assembly factor BamB